MQSRKNQSPNGRGREILKENLKQKIFNKRREKYLQNGKEKKIKKMESQSHPSWYTPEG